MWFLMRTGFSVLRKSNSRSSMVWRQLLGFHQLSTHEGL
jgi:hypothetical protein